MPTPMEVSDIAIRHGRDKKRRNAIAGLVCGVVPAVSLSVHSSFAASWKLWLLGIIVGLIWANGFEYVYHRWLLHRPRSPLAVAHREHHSQIDTPEQAEYVALVSSVLNVVLLFIINGVPVVLIASLMGMWGVLSGLLIGWAVYLILTEEIHWRIHMGQWLPVGLRFSRTYHMSHHATPNTSYNVFLPFFDFLFGTKTRADRGNLDS